MKKTIALVILALFLVSCTTGTDTTPTPVTPATPPSSSPGSPAVEQPSGSATLPEDLTELINKGLSVKSFEYTGGEPGITFFVKDDKIKKTRTTFAESYKPGEYYTHIYIDRSAQTAHAACLAVNGCGEYHNTAYAVSFDEENPETPLDVLNSIAQRTDAVKKGSAFVRQRKATLVSYTNSDGLREEVAIENYYGIPVERTVYDADGAIVTKTTYEFLRLNQIKDSEVEMTATVRE